MSAVYPLRSVNNHFSCPQPYPQVITYSFNDPDKKPRFGDNLVALIRALYLAYKYKMPIACETFKGFEQLKISQLLGQSIEGISLLDPQNVAQKMLTHLKHDEDIHHFLSHHSQSPEYHIVPYGPYDSEYDYAHFRDREGNPFPRVPINHEDAGFIHFLNQLIDPIQPYPPIVTPHRTTVAIHYRTGGTFDTSDVIAKYPDKFSNFDFYHSQLTTIYKVCGSDVYCHLFTDGDPKKLFDQFKSHFPSFTIAYTLNATPLQDFFGIAKNKWTYLIRPDSQFSALAGLLGQPEYELKQNLGLQQNNIMT